MSCMTLDQGGITCEAIHEPRKSLKAINKRVIINFRNKNVVIMRFCNKNEVFVGTKGVLRLPMTYDNRPVPSHPIPEIEGMTKRQNDM